MTYHLTHISKWASILNDTICIDDWEQQNILWKLEIIEEHYWFKCNILLLKLFFILNTYLQASFNIHYISGSYHTIFIQSTDLQEPNFIECLNKLSANLANISLSMFIYERIPKKPTNIASSQQIHVYL